MKLYLVGAAIVAVLALAVWGGWQSNVADRLRADYDALKAGRSKLDAEAARVLGEVRAKDLAIEGLSRQVKDLSREADAAKARAGVAEARAAAAESKVAGHQAEIARLTALAASRPRLDTRERAVAYLRSLGYPSGPYAMPEARPSGTQRP